MTETEMMILGQVLARFIKNDMNYSSVEDNSICLDGYISLNSVEVEILLRFIGQEEE